MFGLQFFRIEDVAIRSGRLSVSEIDVHIKRQPELLYQDANLRAFLRRQPHKVFDPFIGEEERGNG